MTESNAHKNSISSGKPFLSASVVFLVLITTVLARIPQAEGKTKRKRSIAVLEFRARVDTPVDVTERIVEILKKKTTYKVIDIYEARRRRGAEIESETAECAGDAECMADVGRKLGVDEVLLVGLTQLGDVILSLSRILTRNAKVAGRTGASISTDKEILSKQLLKSVKQIFPAEAFRRYGFINIRSNQEGAAVKIGEKIYGKTPLSGAVKIDAPADYKILVKKDGFMTFSADLQVPPDATITVNADLIPEIKEAGPPVYKKWWFWTVLGGSAAAAVAGTVAGLLLWRNSQSQPAQVVITW